MIANCELRIAELQQAWAGHNRCAANNPQSAIQNPQFRSGLTLIELLLVSVILVTLVATALPVLTPTTSERRIREATRGLNTYITKVQAQAISTGRPVGIALKRLSSETQNDDARGVCLEVFTVEQPAPYAGFDENSAVRVALNDPDTMARGFNFPTVLLQFITRGGSVNGLQPGWSIDLFPGGVVRPGDIIEVQGNRYELLHSTLDNNRVGMPSVTEMQLDNLGFFAGASDQTLHFVHARPLNDTGQLVIPTYANNGFRLTPEGVARLVATNNPSTRPYWTEPSAYKIYRQPTTTSAAPYQLPNGIAVDLEASGVIGDIPFHWEDGNDNGTNNSSANAGETPYNVPIYIMFTPEGSIERVQYLRRDSLGNDVSIRTAPTANVSLLVGRRELIPADRNVNLTSANQNELEQEKNKLNWLNLESRWVTIGVGSGSIVTTENAFVTPSLVPAADYDGDGNRDDDPLGRRMGQITAAQEFAREMQRAGGR